MQRLSLGIWEEIASFFLTTIIIGFLQYIVLEYHINLTLDRVKNSDCVWSYGMLLCILQNSVVKKYIVAFIT